ncbi:hypothetical protein TNIN_140981 [Trichonephila inaurata madagascariensis]|uniref:Uncharacterized protein n=1 Tax=Trichonephila inaurata madagascariensis TaxID=2747483 RepID=A0A8X6Y6R0_9ARAC|nr:hypothetical protein TNIN_140981 [Trichonephila inaurata madagascariensis]
MNTHSKHQDSQDSNLESPDPKSGALSVAPLSHAKKRGEIVSLKFRIWCKIETDEHASKHRASRDPNLESSDP